MIQCGIAAPGCVSYFRVSNGKPHLPIHSILTLIISVHDTVHMKAITYTAARENLAATMDRACRDHDPVIITRNRDQAVVMMSLDDYESLEETAYLLRSPINAQRLQKSIAQLESGKGKRKKIDLDS